VKLTTTRSDDELLVKHHLRTATKKDWKVQAWVSGARAPVWYPITVYVRLTPEDKNTQEPPKTKVVLELTPAGKGGTERKREVEPAFKDCCKMQKRRETTYHDGKWGEVTSFPPDRPCWEVTIEDAFHSDRRLPGTTPFTPGEYSLAVTVHLEGVGQVTLDLIPQTLYTGRGG